MSFRRMRHVKAREVQGCTSAYDASVGSSLYDATTGGSLAAYAGTVARWEDISGNGNHLTQATSGNMPKRTQASINGMDALIKNASTTNIRAASFYPSSGTNAFSILIIANPETGASYSVAAQYGNGSYDGQAITAAPRYNGANSAIDDNAAYAGRSGSNPENSGVSVYSFVRPSGSQLGSIKQYVNSKQITINYSHNSTDVPSTGTGLPLVLCNHGTNSYPVNKMGEFASYSSDIPVAVWTRLNCSRARKWRIAT